VTGTAISRHRRRAPRAVLIAASLIAATACGGAASSPFGWLTPRAVPRGWSFVTIPNGARLAYPSGWRRIHGDPGTATVVLLSPGGRYIGYLNVTPRQGGETVAGWPSFRVSHNGEEGDRNVKRLAAATRLRFLDGSGSCVKDSYTTSIGTTYIEIACLVTGPSSASVIVAAATPSSWGRESPVLERAISGFRA
jgi:hypothetical protein